MVYTERVKDVMEFIQENPINVKSQRMFYVPTSQLDPARLPDVVENLQAEDVILERKEHDRINRPQLNKMEEHMADVTVAMLYLACGGMDESHNIVLPYSWPDQEAMSGPPILNSPAIKESEYCHALVHRKEGDILGELGTIGFNNCKFWFRKTGYHPLFKVVNKEALALGSKYPGSRSVASFLDQIKGNENVWHPDVFSDLCANALTSREDEDMMKFCNELSGKEWQLLMDHCNAKTNPENLL